MTKIEFVYEKIGHYAHGEKIKELMDGLEKSLVTLEYYDKLPTGHRDEWYPEQLRIAIADVMFYLLGYASVRGACLECLSSIMTDKLKFLEKRRNEMNIIVPPPTVINKDNTGSGTK